MKIWQYGRFGSTYGAWVGVAIGISIPLYLALVTLINWPQDGIGEGFLGGFLSLLLFFAFIGWLLGLIGGFIFGVIGSLGRSPIVWVIGGIVGGLISSLLFERIMWSLTRNRPDFLTFFLHSLPIALIPSVVLAIIGWLVGSAICTGRPKMPLLHRLTQQKNN